MFILAVARYMYIICLHRLVYYRTDDIQKYAFNGKSTGP